MLRAQTREIDTTCKKMEDTESRAQAVSFNSYLSHCISVLLRVCASLKSRSVLLVRVCFYAVLVLAQEKFSRDVYRAGECRTAMADQRNNCPHCKKIDKILGICALCVDCLCFTRSMRMLSHICRLWCNSVHTRTILNLHIKYLIKTIRYHAHRAIIHLF